MLDEDLARIYGVSTSRLNEQVKHNRKRLPTDFVFRLTAEERSRWNSRHAFTEHGAVMLAAILNTPVAVEASVQIVRAFQASRPMEEWELPKPPSNRFILYPPIWAKR